jgi:regulatory protein
MGSGASREQAQENALAAALRFAERKRIGPYAIGEPDREARQKAFAAMMRAGHSMDVVREVLNASLEDIPHLHNE